MAEIRWEKDFQAAVELAGKSRIMQKVEFCPSSREKRSER